MRTIRMLLGIFFILIVLIPLLILLVLLCIASLLLCGIGERQLDSLGESWNYLMGSVADFMDRK